MYKAFIVGIMLLNYFLVVVVTNFTTANAIKYTHTYSSQKPYVHAPDCQQRFYLQLDCFEKCNQEEQLDTPATPMHQYLLLLTSGLDFHYAVSLLPSSLNVSGTLNSLLSYLEQALAPGFTLVSSPPPLLA